MEKLNTFDIERIWTIRDRCASLQHLWRLSDEQSEKLSMIEHVCNKIIDQHLIDCEGTFGYIL